MPSADLAHTRERGFAHALLERWIVGELLEAGGDGFRRSDGNHKALYSVGEKIFSSGVGAADERAAARKSLRLHQGQAFFNGGQHHHMAAAHDGGEPFLREVRQELNVVLR
jgi:hypothetical protein